MKVKVRELGRISEFDVIIKEKQLLIEVAYRRSQPPFRSNYRKRKNQTFTKPVFYAMTHNQPTFLDQQRT